MEVKYHKVLRLRHYFVVELTDEENAYLLSEIQLCRN